MTGAKSVQDLLVIELTDLLNAGWQIHEALPRMIQRVTSRELKNTLVGHHTETEAHVRRLQMIFDELQVEPDTAHPSKAVADMLAQGQEAGGDLPPGEAQDAAIVGVLQQVEHYELAGYTTASLYARMLGRSRIAGLLGKTLAEEERAYKQLTSIAESMVARVALV